MAKGKTKVIQIEPKEQSVSKELVNHLDTKLVPELLIIDPERVKEKILTTFSPVFTKLSEWKDKVNSIEVNNEDDKEGMQMARESRLFIKNTRVDLEKIVLAEINDVKSRMQPLMNEQLLWKDVLDFSKSMMKNIETIADDKEKYVIKLKEERKKLLVAQRMEKAKQYEGFMPFRPDISYLSDEEFESDLVFGKLAFEKDQEDKLKLEKERKENEEKAAKLQIINDRMSKISSLGMTFDDGFYKYLDVCNISVEQIGKITDEEFDFYIKSFDKKIGEYKAKQFEKEKEREEGRRKELLRRANLFLDVAIKGDGIYYSPGGDQQPLFIMSHDDLYLCSENDLMDIVARQNKIAEQNRFRRAEELEALAAKKEKEETERLTKIAQLKLQQEQEKERLELKRKQDEEKALQAKAPDKEKLQILSDLIHELKTKDVPVDKEMNTELGKKIAKNTYDLLGKVVRYIDENVVNL